MLSKWLLSILLCAPTLLVHGQEIKKGKSGVGDEQLKYYFLEPEKAVVGILIILPGWGEKAKSIFNKSTLPALIADKGFATIVPELRPTLFADDASVSAINRLIKTQREKYQSPNLNFVIGGLSAGGAIALGYVESEIAKDTAKRIKGVFAIDAPLDLARMYTSAENKIRYACTNKLIMKEGHFVKHFLLTALKGSPLEKPDDYLKYSVYSKAASNGGNAKLLINIPVRLYSEPDLAFVKKEYCRELQYEDINASDLEKLDNYLRRSGNTKAEYLQTKGKGFHSWNILDGTECTSWIMNIIK